MRQSAGLTTLFNPSATRAPALPPELSLSRHLSDEVRAGGGIIEITPALAARILELLNFPHQRKIKQANVDRLTNVIVGGMWDSTHPITFARMPNGRLVGVNLQHRMHAIVAANKAVPVQVLISDRADELEVSKLYSGFDQRGSLRGEIDSLAARDLQSETGLNLTTIQLAFNALKVLLNDMEPTANASMKDKVLINMFETRMAEFPQWVEQVRAWYKILCLAPKHVRAKLRSHAVMAVGLYTLKHQPVDALNFWTGLAENSGLAKDDARARLLVDFQSRKGASSRELIHTCSIAWNAYFNNRKLGGIRIDAGHTLRLDGTPLTPRKYT